MALNYGKLKALVVEDNDFIRFTIMKNLTSFGFGEVLEARNGMEGLEWLEQRPDIIVCDINMEPMNGHEFLLHLRKSPDSVCNTPVIFLTSNGDEENVQRALKLHINAYLLKPVTPDALRKKIATLLSQSAGV